MNQQHSQLSDKDRLDMLEKFRRALVEQTAPRIEEFLSSVPENDKTNIFVELLELEIAAQESSQETIIGDDYIKRFPEYEQFVVAVFEKGLNFPDTETHHVKRDDSTHIQSSKDVPEIEKLQPDKEVNELGDFNLHEVLGRGGMGVVYKAHQKSLNRTVALKLIRAGELADQMEVDRFKVEAQSAALLQHPGIVSIFETGEIDNQHYIAMAYVEGQSLAEKISDKPVTMKEAATIALPISEAVAYAHKNGVIHRDLKPANVLIDQNGNPKLTDFGLAKQLEGESSLTASGDILGTPSYMPPEQAEGHTNLVTESADIYSLGAILYTMLCGRPPFQADNSYLTLMQVVSQEPVSPRQLNPSIPIDLETICMKCLEKDPKRRYASADDLAKELIRFLSGEPIEARPISTPARLWRWCKRKPLIASLSAAVVSSLILGLSFSIYYRIIAEKRAKRAEEGTRIALTTLESVINTIQNKLYNIPEARDIRKELLRNSMADLEMLSGEVNSQGRVDYNSAKVLVSLGLLFKEVGDDSGLNAVSAAETNFKKAVEIFKQLPIQKENQTISQKEILNLHARALEELGNLYIDSKRATLAEEPVDQTIAIRKKLVKLYPDDLKQQGELVWAIKLRGDILTAKRQFKRSLKYYIEADSITGKLHKAEPDNHDYAQLFSVIKQILGDTYHDLKQNDKAIQYFEEDFNLLKTLIERFPEKRAYQYDLSTSYERLGNHWLQVGDVDKAEKMYKQMLSQNQKVLDKDPKNLKYLDGHLVSYLKLRKVYFLLKKSDKVKEANEEIARLRKVLNLAK